MQLVLAAALVRCIRVHEPQATRMRGSGHGGDPGNRSTVVEMHEGSKPYHETPQLVEPYGLKETASARQAHRLSLGNRAKSR